MRRSPVWLVSLPVLIGLCLILGQTWPQSVWAAGKSKSAPTSKAKPSSKAKKSKSPARQASKKPAKPEKSNAASTATVLIGDEAAAAVARKAKENAEPVKCAVESLTKARDRFQKTSKSGEVARAVKDLQRQISATCNQLPTKYVDAALNRAYYWASNDLASGYLEMKDPKRCLDVLAPHLSPEGYSAIGFEDNEEFVVALERTEKSCMAAVEKNFGDFADATCPLTSDRGVARIRVSEATAREPSCLIVESGGGRKLASVFSSSDESVDPSRSKCAKLALLTDDDSKAVPVSGDGPLTDASRCCFINNLRSSIQKQGSRMRIRLQGPFRECGEYTARGLVDAIYVFDGAKLTLEKDMTVFGD